MGGCFHVQPFWQVMFMNFLPIAFCLKKGLIPLDFTTMKNEGFTPINMGYNH